MLLTLMTVMAVTSCDESKKRKALLPNISGKAGEVIIVIDKGDWEGAIGSVLRDSLAAECPFLPQKEPLYTLVNVAPSGFTNLFKVHRNLVLVNVSADVVEPGVVFRQDIWAAPQCVININASDSEKAVALIKENTPKILSYLEQAERDRVIANTKKYEELSISPVVSSVLGGSPRFPSGYRIKMKTDDFVWVTYEPQYTQQSVLAFKYPVVAGQEMLGRQRLITDINAVLEKNVPGMFENTYMTIAAVVEPSLKYMTYKGHEFAEMKGLWDVHNDFMGGPFVAHAFYSRDGKDVIVLFSFVYAPKYDKRHYLRQVESILYSFAWADEEKGDRKK